MPRDDWAKAKAIDFGRKAKASGEYEQARSGRPFRRHPGRGSRKVTAKSVPCAKCGSRKETLTVQKFKDSSVHVRADCKKCGTFKKWNKT